MATLVLPAPVGAHTSRFSEVLNAAWYTCHGRENDTIPASLEQVALLITSQVIGDTRKKVEQSEQHTASKQAQRMRRTKIVYVCNQVFEDNY